MKIAGFEIGPQWPPLMIAEISANHNGDLERAKAIIAAAAQSGADMVKLQVYDPIRLATSRGGLDKVIASGPWQGRTLLDIYSEGCTPLHWVPELFDWAAKAGITLFASVFDEQHVDFLVECGCPALKISSFELTNTRLIAKAASTGKPLIMSTGMADGKNISAALQAAAGTTQIALLHCVSDYPCPVEKANLGRIEHMRRVYAKPIGWSDHTLGSTAAIAAVAVGACIVEKHLTLSRADGGLDAAFSVEPDEFRAMADACRQTWLAMQEPAEASEPYKHLRSVA